MRRSRRRWRIRIHRPEGEGPPTAGRDLAADRWGSRRPSPARIGTALTASWLHGLRSPLGLRAFLTKMVQSCSYPIDVHPPFWY